MMNKPISEQIKDEILSHYQEPFHLLKAIEADFPTSSVHFSLNSKQYTNTERGGLSSVNSLILVNQAAISAIAINLYNKKIPGLEEIDLEIKDVADFAEMMIVSRYDSLSFKRPILREQEQPHTMTLTIDKIMHRPSKGLTFFKISYEICDHSFTGNLTATYYPDKLAEK